MFQLHRSHFLVERRSTRIDLTQGRIPTCCSVSELHKESRANLNALKCVDLFLATRRMYLLRPKKAMQPEQISREVTKYSADDLITVLRKHQLAESDPLQMAGFPTCDTSVDASDSSRSSFSRKRYTDSSRGWKSMSRIVVHHIVRRHSLCICCSNILRRAVLWTGSLETLSTKLDHTLHSSEPPPTVGNALRDSVFSSSQRRYAT